MLESSRGDRREFEAWMVANSTATLSRESDNYLVYEVDCAWRAWQAARAESKRLRRLLIEIAEYAHNHSTGPTVPDALWEVRQMAYEIPQHS